MSAIIALRCGSSLNAMMCHQEGGAVDRIDRSRCGRNFGTVTAALDARDKQHAARHTTHVHDLTDLTIAREESRNRPKYLSSRLFRLVSPGGGAVCV